MINDWLLKNALHLQNIDNSHCHMSSLTLPSQWKHQHSSTMATPRKTILVVGLGETVSDNARTTFNFDPSKTMELVAAEVEKAKTRGFDCTVFVVEPWRPAETLAELKTQLQKRRWDGVSIGYAVRALKENTPIFEETINMTAEFCPGAKFVFPLGREDVWEAIRRAFGVEE